MSQDLSQTIQDGIAQTLTDLLGIDAKFIETTKIDRRDIQEHQLLQVNAEFEFDKLSTILKFMIPASTASIIFNTMMGASDFDISDTIDDDTSDAMGEFVSNTSGSLVTAFNAKEIEDLGKAKFNIQHKEVLDGSSVENIDTIYRFVIDLDDTPLTLFINFAEQFYPFIEEITKSETTPYPDEEPPAAVEDEPNEIEEEIETLEEEEISEPKSVITGDASLEENKQESKDTETKDESEEEEIELEDEETQKKAKKMKLLIIIISSLIALILIIFLALFFMSSDEEEMETPEQQIEQMDNANSENTQEGTNNTEEIKTTPNKTLKKINFNIKDIDIARLNGRLATLTKYEILTKEELEVQKKEEEKRLERLKKEEELQEFAKLNKEEPIKVLPKQEPKAEIKKEMKPVAPKEETPIIKEEATSSTIQMVQKEIVEKEIPVKTEQASKPKKLLFVLTKSIKYTLFKSLVLQTNSQSARISMCNDTDGRTTILIGPFATNEQQLKMDQLIKNSDKNIITSLEGLTNDEFNQRCNF